MTKTHNPNYHKTQSFDRIIGSRRVVGTYDPFVNSFLFENLDKETGEGFAVVLPTGEINKEIRKIIKSENK